MTAPPRIAVVFATHDRARRLERLFEALRRQSVGREAFEVVAVDDASSDDTPEVLEREVRRGELALTTLRLDVGSGPAAARNAGWRAASAPLVAFTDDDCRPAPDWLAAGLRRLEDGAGIVQGRTEPDPEEAHLQGPFSRSLCVRRLGPFFQTCNVMYQRALLERVGGFDQLTFTVPGGEDADLAWRALATGARAVFAPDALVHHAVSPLGPVGKLRVAWRWTETMRLFARYPDLRREELTHGLFWKGSHYLLFRALVAAVLPRRVAALRLWLARPYFLHLIDRGRVDGGGPLLAPYFLVHDLVEMAAAARGAVRYRTMVL